MDPNGRRGRGDLTIALTIGRRGIDVRAAAQNQERHQDGIEELHRRLGSPFTLRRRYRAQPAPPAKGLAASDARPRGIANNWTLVPCHTGSAPIARCEVNHCLHWSAFALRSTRSTQLRPTARRIDVPCAGFAIAQPLFSLPAAYRMFTDEFVRFRDFGRGSELLLRGPSGAHQGDSP